MYLMCDKGCQYGANLVSRFRTSFPHLSQHAEKLHVLINKLHLQGHKDDCRFEFAPHYTQGCGRTDGEAIERNWADCNDIAKNTLDQNPGHRIDTLDGSNEDRNDRRRKAMRAWCIF